MLPALFCVALAFQHSAAPDDKSAWIYSPSGSYFVDVPHGWMVDTKTLKDRGVPALFYPKNESWDSAPVVIYANFVEKDKETPTFDAVIAHDIADTKSHGTSIKVTKLRPIQTEDHRSARIYEFDNPNSNAQSVEICAYIEMKKTVALLVMSAKAGVDIKAPEKTFDALVASFAGSDVGTKLKKGK